MRKVYKYAIWIVSLAVITGQCAYAQSDSNVFARQAKLIFTDNFHKTPAGKFPSNWVIAKCNDGRMLESIKSFAIVRDDTGSILQADGEEQPFIEPIVYYRDSYLTNNFTLEYDFTFTSGAERVRHCLHFIPAGKSQDCEQALVRIANDTRGNFFLTYESKLPRPLKKEVSLGRSFDISAWHRLAVSYKDEKIKYFLDNKLLMIIAKCGYQPKRIALHGAFSMVKYRDVKIALAPFDNSMSNMLRGTFVSHDILFEVNKSIVQAESDSFLTELSQFLLNHPSVAIVISGHTDNDGDSLENMKLSLDRATEVKRQLVARGVIESKLAVKGYGATKPLLPNTTPSAKAQNRRVEFSKL